MQGRSTDGADCPGEGRGGHRPTALRSVVEGGTPVSCWLNGCGVFPSNILLQAGGALCGH